MLKASLSITTINLFFVFLSGDAEKEGACALGEEFMNSLVELIVDVPVL